MQIGLDENDINVGKNFKGDVEGSAVAVTDVVDVTAALSPYSEVFGLQRFRETELIHGRWAMLGVLGALVAEGVTGESWCVARGGRFGVGAPGGKGGAQAEAVAAAQAALLAPRAAGSMASACTRDPVAHSAGAQHEPHAAQARADAPSPCPPPHQAGRCQV